MGLHKKGSKKCGLAKVMAHEVDLLGKMVFFLSDWLKSGFMTQKCGIFTANGCRTSWDKRRGKTSWDKRGWGKLVWDKETGAKLRGTKSLRAKLCGTKKRGPNFVGQKNGGKTSWDRKMGAKLRGTKKE